MENEVIRIRKAVEAFATMFFIAALYAMLVIGVYVVHTILSTLGANQ